MEHKREFPDSKTIRIACVLPSLDCGGAERVMVGFSSGLAALGYHTTVLTLNPDVPDFFQLSGSVVRRRLPPDATIRSRWLDLRSQQKRITDLRDAILQESPDLVISFLDTTNVMVLIALIGSGIPVIAAEHTDPRSHAIAWPWRVMRRLAYPLASTVVVLNPSIGRWASSLWPRWRVLEIPNPVEPVQHQEACSPPAWFGRFNLVAVGRLEWVKGFDLLIEAFARVADSHADWHLSILGEGAERGRLEAMIRAAGLDNRIHLPGRVQKPERIVACADMLVMSSHFESFPMALLEAMSAGLPVISFDCPSGPGAIIRQGIDGILVRPGDTAALAESMDRLMTDEPERRRLGAAAKHVAGRYSSGAIMARWQALIGKVLAA